ncbi:hypothetical protein FCM35_KLT21322 [Carex littledalei]|uniref:Uncharacterized protein n=1 Tax=Carex littledalei TaxID=544730 RepID=A0A833RHE3_9POAL|nr:hypothetical protein FCM35_KLT21322 [Carex littledalei]
MAPIRKLNKRVMAIKHICGLDGLGLLQAAGEFIKAEHDSNDANEQVGNVAGAEEDAIPIVEERPVGSKVLGIDLNLPIVEETSDVERVDLPDPAPVDVNAPPMRRFGDLSIELVRPMLRKLQNEAAKELRVSQTTLKTWCRIEGIWNGLILESERDSSDSE